MFVFSKIVLFVLNPGHWLFALLVGGTVLLWTRWRRAGRWILTITCLLIALPTVLPIGQLMIATLEDRFPVVRQLDGPVDGIVVLGGTIQQIVTRYRGQPSLTDGAERLTEFVALAKRYPSARLIFTGGSGLLGRQDIKEADTARLLFAQLGLETARIVFESESRNTYENALYSHRIARPAPGQRWILVTSAMHMPRSVGVFRKAGWNPVPYPVDFHTWGPAQRGVGFVMLSGLGSLALGLREWAALVAYRVLGRTDAIFPGPQT
jgi:uncharacterized SAM-binding protein YcdF (DUF218 family)